MNALEWGLLLLLALIWGCSFFFVAIALWELPPLTVVAMRVAIAAVVLHIVIRLMGIALPMTRAAWTSFLIMGIINNVIPFTLLTWGQMYVASGVASILNATTPIFTALIAHVATTDEKLTANRALGTVLGMVGVAVMIGGSNLSGMRAIWPANWPSSPQRSPMAFPACSRAASVPSASLRSPAPRGC